MKEAEGYQAKKRRRSTLLVLAITLHNIPEGLAVGGAFGAVAAGFPSASLIPGSQEEGNKDLASMSLMVGFTVMMILDVALG
jgi:zinc transporter ZupT